MTTSKQPSLFAGYRFPAEIIAHVVWLYFRFPLSLRMVDEMPAARGIVISHGVTYEERGLSKLIRRLGIRKISSRPLHPKNDPEIQAEYK